MGASGTTVAWDIPCLGRLARVNATSQDSWSHILHCCSTNRHNMMDRATNALLAEQTRSRPLFCLEHAFMLHTSNGSADLSAFVSKEEHLGI